MEEKNIIICPKCGRKNVDNCLTFRYRCKYCKELFVDDEDEENDDLGE